MLSISRHKGILNKHLNTCYEHSNIEKRNELIRLLNKLRYLNLSLNMCKCLNKSQSRYPPIKSYWNQCFQVSKLLKYNGNIGIT